MRVFDGGMEFLQALDKWSAPEIAEKLGCPERIAYAWKKGERQPRPWIQKLILEALKRPTKGDSQKR